MSERPELAASFTPADIEGVLYQKWIDAGYFKADAKSEKPPFTIVIPPLLPPQDAAPRPGLHSTAGGKPDL